MVKKKRKRVSARRRVDEKRKGDTSSYLRLLEGIKSFEMDGKPRVVDILSWPVKQSNAYADKGDLYFEKTFWVHNSIGPNKDRVVCPAKTLGKRCPICDHKARLANDPESDADLIKSLNPKERQLFLINDLKSDDGGLQVWDVSYYLFGKNLEERLATADEDDDWMGYADPEEGLSLRIAFSEEPFQGKVYYSTASIDFRPRKAQ